MADAPNDPKADLKARLARKATSAAPVAAQPIVPGAPPPEPEKPKAPPKPTQATIDDARRRAAEADQAAGPSVESFSVMGPERTPLPAALPTGPRVEYVEVKGSEELPEAAKKRRTVLIIAVLGAAVVAFFLGRTVAGSSALSGLKESILLEAKDKAKLFEDKKPTFALIEGLKQQLVSVDKVMQGFDPKTGDITTLEKPFADLIGAMAKFAGNKQAALDPAEIMGERIYNASLMKEVIAYAYATQTFQNDVANAVGEAQELLRANPVPPPDRQKLSVIAEPDTFDVEGLGPVPLSKGTIVLQPGPPSPVQLKDATGAPLKDAAGNAMVEFYQKVKVEGREEAVQIKTSQLVVVDMAPFWNNLGQTSKRAVLTRLAAVTSKLLDQVKKLDPKAVIAAIEKVGTAGEGKAEEPKAEEPKAEPAK